MLDQTLQPLAIPQHVAIIMDGNGRWAREKGLPRNEGHKAGVKRVRPLVEECRKKGIRYLTIFCFSTENWNRPQLEISALMKLFMFHLQAEVEDLRKSGVRLRAIGDRTKLPPAVLKALQDAEEKTKECSELNLILALSYGAREELVYATKEIVRKVNAGQLRLDSISAQTISDNLYGPDIPDPDLLIRTSGEFRISNFLLWQLAYTEIIITPIFWPDFSVSEFQQCLVEFGNRTRRFGLTDEQLKESEVA